MFGVRLTARGASLRASALLFLCVIGDVSAAEQDKLRRIGRSESGTAAVRLGDLTNQNTVGVVSGNISGTISSSSRAGARNAFPRCRSASSCLRNS